MLTHLCIVHACFHITMRELNSFQERLYSPKTLKYLLTGPLQIKFASPWSKWVWIQTFYSPILGFTFTLLIFISSLYWLKTILLNRDNKSKIGIEARKSHYLLISYYLLPFLWIRPQKLLSWLTSLLLTLSPILSSTIHPLGCYSDKLFNRLIQFKYLKTL